jgi:hypothetical protein
MTPDNYYARGRLYVVSRLTVASERWFAAHPRHERTLVAFELEPGMPSRRRLARMLARDRRANRAIARLARGMHDRLDFPADATAPAPVNVRSFSYAAADVACPECHGRGFQCDRCAPMGRG